MVTEQANHENLGRYDNQRRVEGRRLSYYVRAANVGYWDQNWDQLLAPRIFARAALGELPIEYATQFLRYLPATGRILEAGCGMGQFILALRSRGYEAEGIEWSEKTVERVREMRPELPIRSGDVTQLSVPDAFYAGYISLGVVEHSHSGPHPYLKEAFRVLEPGGVMIITVPYFNPLRRLKARLGYYQSPVEESEFFQFAFLAADFHEQIRQAGFRIIETSYNSVVPGLSDEISWFRRLARYRIIRGPLRQVGERIGLLTRLLGHMQMVVAIKPK